MSLKMLISDLLFYQIIKLEFGIFIKKIRQIEVRSVKLHPS